MINQQHYLADLLDFAERRVRVSVSGNAVTRQQLANAFRQPFTRLADEEHQAIAERPVLQVRLAVEVLRRLLDGASAPNESGYRLTAYDALLRAWAISYAEIQAANELDGGGDEAQAARQSLARRLGIAPGRADAFLLEPQDVTEARLEELFGLRSTTRDPLEPLEDVPLLLAWQLEQLPDAPEERRRGATDGRSPRAELEQALDQSLRAAVDGAEAEALPRLRDALVEAVGAEHDAPERQRAADGLTQVLAIDFCNSGSIKTTRLDQAIQTLQVILFGLRIGRFSSRQRLAFLSDLNAAANWELAFNQHYKEEHFDQDWRLLGTYGTWGGALLTLVYPDGLLMPGLLAHSAPHHQPSQAFRTLIGNLRSMSQLTPRRARQLANGAGNTGAGEQGYLAGLRSELGDDLPAKFHQDSFVITEQLSDAELVNRKDEVEKLFPDKLREKPNDPINQADRLKWLRLTPTWLKEIYYFVPMALALHLQRSGHFLAALDWYQTIYAYNWNVGQRKIFYGLEIEEKLPLAVFRNPDDWLRGGLNPHDIAGERGYAYTRFTLTSLVGCFVDFADAEFTRATSDAIPRARSLYLTALDLLELPELLPPEDERAVANPVTGSGPAPLNPAIATLRRRAELNLRKLRGGRNIAGMERPREPERQNGALAALPGGVPGLGVRPSSVARNPTIYRYEVLLERAKQLVGIAQQVEGAFLAALEKGDTEAYNLLQARQDLELSEATVQLQNLRVDEAAGEVELAQLQQERAETQRETYQQWLDDGLNGWEQSMLKSYSEAGEARQEAARLQHASSIISGWGQAAVNPATALGWWGSSLVGSLATSASVRAIQAETRATVASARASFERRNEQWRLQKSLAEKDVAIGAQHVELAQQQVGIVVQERAIAATQSDNARVAAEFLANKFTNADLYEWMSGILGRVYSFFLQQASATAQMAQDQLAFERQEAPPSFIQSDYWQAPAEADPAPGADGQAPDRRGLTGSARLLQDIYRLDQYAFETNRRKLQLSQTMSLSQLFPFEFQQFRETGVLPFATPMELFDRGFPGHYLRLIKQVHVSVIALIPPGQGVRATLSSSGLSRVVIGPDVFRAIEVRRSPELIAFTSPVDASGLLDLEPEQGMLRPFESTGVDTTWELRMPKAANPFDYQTIADVLVTVEYTALDSSDYRRQVIRQLDRSVEAERSFSFRQEFADAWYDLHNPDQADEQRRMAARFTTGRQDFPPNVEGLEIEHILLYFARADGASFEIPVSHLHFTALGEAEPLGGGATTVDGLISTRRANGASWLPIAGRPPAGAWELALEDTPEVRDRFKNEQIEDILLVIGYAGETPAWPDDRR